MSVIENNGRQAPQATMERIYMSSPDITQAEEDALVRAIRSGWVAPLGPEVDAFERELAERCGRKHCVALSSGTAALHLGLLNLGVRPGDVVMTASMTFAATANAVTYVNAIPAFVDCDETGNMDPMVLEEGIKDQLARGNRVSAIIPVDLLGKMADYDSIDEIGFRYGIPVLADAAEALGARRNGRPAGSRGRAAVLSFNGNKIITTSGGGALLTDEKEIADRARYLATQARQPVIHYEHTEIGYNYRLSNLLAALGRAQLQRLDEMIAKRRAIREEYRLLFAHQRGVTLFGQPDEIESMKTRDNFWLSSIVVDAKSSSWTRSALMNHLDKMNIESRPLWKPMHLQPVFANLPNYVEGTAERLFETSCSLPSGSALSQSQIKRGLGALNEFFNLQMHRPSSRERIDHV